MIWRERLSRSTFINMENIMKLFKKYIDKISHLINPSFYRIEREMKLRSELQGWRSKAQDSYDNKFGKGSLRGYAWIGFKIGVEECFIFMMNIDQCKQVIDLCGRETK